MGKGVGWVGEIRYLFTTYHLLPLPPPTILPLPRTISFWYEARVLSRAAGPWRCGGAMVVVSWLRFQRAKWSVVFVLFIHGRLLLLGACGRPSRAACPGQTPLGRLEGGLEGGGGRLSSGRCRTSSGVIRGDVNDTA